MSFTTVELTPRIGTEVRTDLDTLLGGSIAKRLRVLLEQRGVLLFRGHNMSDEQQIKFGSTLGTVRLEHGLDVTKIIADKKQTRFSPITPRGPISSTSTAPIPICQDWRPSCGQRVVAPKGGQTEFCNT